MVHPAADLQLDALTVDERLNLLGRLWDSLLDAGPPPIPAWHLEEVRRRATAADADQAASTSLEDLRRELRRDSN